MKIQMTTTRALQIGLLFLLAISFAQVVWWTLDQVFFTSQIVRTAETHFGHDLEAAALLRAAGTPVEDILEIFPHISVGVDQTSIRPEAISLAGTIAGARRVLEERARKYDVDIIVEVDEALMVHADPVATRMVVQNLLENAIKATAAAGGGRITVFGRRDGDRVKLEIRDTDIGFPPAESKKLFEKFYRSGDEMRRTSSGTGLGLYIVHRLMLHQKGRVRAHSEGLGKGAVFTTFWPPAAEVKA